MSKLHNTTGSKCMICDEVLIKESYVVFHKTRRQTHSLCIDCTIGYLKPIITQSTNNFRKNIRKGVEFVKCPGSIHSEHRNLCKHKLLLSSLYIPECEISLDFFRLVYAIQTPNVYICPQENCGMIIEVDINYVHNNIVCHGGCKLSWCRNCLITPYHNLKSCIEVETENKSTENGKLISELVEKGKLKFCPQCRAPCIKQDGCNKMICPVCALKWCWICKKDNIDYDHYNTTEFGACNGKLWNGVDENGNDIPIVEE
jgi:hypothetical protein